MIRLWGTYKRNRNKGIGPYIKNDEAVPRRRVWFVEPLTGPPENLFDELPDGSNFPELEEGELNSKACGRIEEGDVTCWRIEECGPASPDEECKLNIRDINENTRVKFRDIEVNSTGGCGLTKQGRIRCWAGILDEAENIPAGVESL